MSEELKPCPFCGKDEANFTTDKWGNYYVECEYCGAQTNPYDDKEIVIEEWQTRPIEDDLRNRIAELEGLVDELKPYRDGYDPEEVFPPEGEWVWLRDCDDNVEVMGYSQKEKCYWNYEGSRMPDDGDIVRWYPIGKLPEVRE